MRVARLHNRRVDDARLPAAHPASQGVHVALSRRRIAAWADGRPGAGLLGVAAPASAATAADGAWTAAAGWGRASGRRVVRMAAAVVVQRGSSRCFAPREIDETHLVAAAAAALGWVLPGSGACLEEGDVGRGQIPGDAFGAAAAVDVSADCETGANAPEGTAEGLAPG